MATITPGGLSQNGSVVGGQSAFMQPSYKFPTGSFGSSLATNGNSSNGNVQTGLTPQPVVSKPVAPQGNTPGLLNTGSQTQPVANSQGVSKPYVSGNITYTPNAGSFGYTASATPGTQQTTSSNQITGNITNPNANSPFGVNTGGTPNGQTRTINDTSGNTYTVDSNGQIVSGPTGGQYQVGSNISSNPGLYQQVTGQQLPSSPSTLPNVTSGLVNTALNGGQTAQGYTSQEAALSPQALALQQQAQDVANNTAAAIQGFTTSGANNAAGYDTGKGTYDVGSGNAAIAQQTAAAKEQGAAAAGNFQLSGINQQLADLGAAQTGYNNAASQSYTGQSQTQTGLNNAGGLITGSYLGNTPYALNLQNGQMIGGDVISNAVQNALQLVRNGADPTSAAVVGPLNALGPTAINAFNQAQLSGGNYNPTTQSAAIQQNVTQGTGSQGQANQLQIGINQLNAIKPLMTNFLSQSGLNSSDSPLANKPIDTYIASLGNSGAAVQYQNMLNEIQNYAATILSSGVMSGTPTGVQAATDLQNPGTLNASQLAADLGTLDTLGNNKLSVLNQNVQANLGSNSGAYAGTPRPLETNTQVSPSNTFTQGLNPENTSQALAGGTIGLGQSAWNAVSNLGGDIVGWIAKGLSSL